MEEEREAREEAARRASRIAEIQNALPQGWTVVDEDGLISVLDPNGDWLQQFDAPPRDMEGLRTLLDEVEEANQRGIREGLYPSPGAPGRAGDLQEGPGDAPQATSSPTELAPELVERLRAVRQGYVELADDRAGLIDDLLQQRPDYAGNPPLQITPEVVEEYEAELEAARAEELRSRARQRRDRTIRTMVPGSPQQQRNQAAALVRRVRQVADGYRQMGDAAMSRSVRRIASGAADGGELTQAQVEALEEALEKARENAQQRDTAQPAGPALQDTPGASAPLASTPQEAMRLLRENPFRHIRLPNGGYVRVSRAREGIFLEASDGNTTISHDDLAGSKINMLNLEEAARNALDRLNFAPAAKPTLAAPPADEAAAPAPSQAPAPNVTTPAPTAGPATGSGAANVTPPSPTGTPRSAPTSDLQARKAAAKAKFAAALRAQGQRLNAGIDPAVLAAGIELGAIYIEEGLVKFREWARAVLKDAIEMGLDPEAVKPVLKPVYLATSAEVPDDLAEQMDDRATVRSFDLDTLDQPEGDTNADRTGGSDAPRGGTPTPPGSRTDAQSGDAQADPTIVGDGAPRDVEAPEGAELDGDDGVPGTAADVGGTGPADEGGDASDGRPRDGGTGAPAAGAGTGARGAMASGGSGPVGGTTGSVKTPAPGSPSAGDFHIADPAALLGGGPVARFNRNRTAIETLNAIRDSDRPATREEQAKLAGYTGWGSFGQDLFKGTWERPDPRPGWEERDRWLREHLGKEAWLSAQASILNAHYTDPPVVLAMWDMVRRAGFEGGRVLEPSMGTGNFFSLMPLDLKARSDLTGIELDTTTAAIAKLLFPDSNIQQMRYQDSRTPDGFYDLVIGNWPFSGQTVPDRRHGKLKPTLHDFFFLKALDQVRAGGLVIGITSNGTMDKESTRVRAHLARNAELVAAFRLPTGAFEGYAGTAVVTDIVMLKKRATPLLETPDEAWVKASMVPTPAGPEVRLNGYFQQNPDRVLGTVNYGSGTTRGSPGLIVDRPDNLMERLTAAVALVPEGVYERERVNNRISYITNHTDDREGALVFQGDVPFIVRGEHLAPADQVHRYEVKDAKQTAARVAQMRELVAMRRAYAELITKERAGEDAEAARAALRGLFTAYEKAHGKLLDSFGMRYLAKIGDPFFPALAALVQKDGTPAAILFRSTMRGKRRLENPSITDAFVVARQQSVRPTLREVAALTGKTTDEVKAALIEAGAVFETVDGDVEPADLYLAGNVRMKLRQAMAAVAAGQNHLQRNVDALKAVQPKDVPYYDIEVQFGATWVPEAVYEEYVAHMLNRQNTDGISIRFTLGRWKARLTDLNGLAAARSGFGMDDRRVPFSRLLQAALSNQTFKVMARDPITGTDYLDQDATKQAAERIAMIRSSFAEWLWKDPERRVTLEEAYNEARNSHATPKYDGSFMAFEGMALSIGRGPFQLREHQVNAIWRAIVNRKSINAHEVGTGKTFTMGGIAVESRRYGIAKKPLILAHNANSKAVATEIQAMYPAAKVLYIDNLAPSDIDVQLRRIANDDWDAVVLPHSQIGRLALSRETLLAIAAEEIAALEEAAIEAAKEDNSALTVQQMDAIRNGDKKAAGRLRSLTAKDLVRARNAVLDKIDALAQRASRDKAVQFENLGIDMILVDEAHEFKKPPIVTGMRMKGLQTATSNMSIALNFLTSYVRRQNNGNNIHTFTGTPITNTLVEIFHQMRYIMLEEMKEAGVDTWDAWFASFAREVQDVELSAAGEYEPITRLAAFINVPELRRLVGRYLDIVFADQMPEMQPRRSKSGKTMADIAAIESALTQAAEGRAQKVRRVMPEEPREARAFIREAVYGNDKGALEWFAAQLADADIVSAEWRQVQGLVNSALALFRDRTRNLPARLKALERERVELENGRTEDATDRPYKKVINVTSEMTEGQVAIFERLQTDARLFRDATGRERFEMLREGHPASPIIVESGANLASFDERMYDRNRLRDSPLAGQEGTAPLDPRSKVAQVVKNVMEIYRSDDRANQVIFADQGYNTTAQREIPGTDPKQTAKVKTFSAILDLVERLVQAGIPREQIALVTGGTSAERKFEIAQDMNEGRLRVVIGRSDTLGVGVNMQRNLRAMHHMDAPYMPGDLEQRNGRGWRQGNQWNTVLEYRYITDRLDGRRWQILAIKQRFILAFLRDNQAGRMIEGEAASDAPSDFLESFAEAAGDPRALIREQMRRKLAMLNQAERMHGQAIADSRRMLTEKLSEKKRITEWLENATKKDGPLAATTALLERIRGDGFTATIGGKKVTHRAGAKAALESIAADMRQGDTDRPVGEIGGVKVSMSWPRLATAPQLRMTLGGHDFDGPSVASLEAQMRGFLDRPAQMRKKAAEVDAEIERLREVVSAPFSRAAQLKQAKQALADLEADLAANPVAPPGWLRIGTPRDSTVFWRGKPFTVTGHRWTRDGWFVLAEDERGSVVIPYMEATDQQGIPAYEERPFTPPVVVDRRAQGQQGGAINLDAPDDAEGMAPSLSEPQGGDRVGDLPEPERILPAALDALRQVLRTIAGPEVDLDQAGEVNLSGPLARAHAVIAGPLVRLAFALEAQRAPWAVRHEAIHALRNMGRITDAEWAILTEAAEREGWAKRFNIAKRYEGVFGSRNDAADRMAEEAVAEAFAEWATGNAPQISGPVARIFQKIRRFLVRLRNAMRNRGFRDESDIFQSIAAGEMGRRPMGERRGVTSMREASAQLDKAIGRTVADTAPADASAGDALDELFASLPAAARTAVKKASTALREERLGVVRRLWKGTPLPSGVEVKERAAARDILPVLSRFRLPTRMFARVPALAELVQRGVAAERRMARWSRTMNDQLDAILGELEKARGSREAVTLALLDADAQGIKIEDPKIAQQHFAHHGLSAAEAKAAAAINTMLVKAARLVDQHRRAMMPQVRREKARLWKRMSELFDRGAVEAEGYAKKYRRRAYLTRRIREGKGDLAAQAAEIASLNADLRAMRIADPDKQEQMRRLQEQYDEAEARLTATSVRRKDGYFPHKFYGSWRLFVLGEIDEETGERARTEITSDQGFYNTRDQAVAAARTYLAQNPGASLVVEPKLVALPGGQGAILSSAEFMRLKRGLEREAGLEGEELAAVLQGVARREARRRTFQPGMKRTGAAGFSRDLERVMRTHFAQTVRYVEMDKMKFHYVSEMERLGLAPVARSTKVTGDDPRAELERAMQAWWRDLNGAPQPGEAVVDRLIAALPLPGATLAAAAVAGVIGTGIANPVVGAMLAAYSGLRLYRAAVKNPDMTTRQFMGDVASDVAHLKLGLVLNLASATVNLSQTVINTYPILGERWTGVGLARAIPALWSLSINAGQRGRMSGDAILLERAGIRSNFSVTADSPAALIEDRTTLERLKKLSMLAFQSAEQINRATAFLGALARAEASGKQPGPAFQEAVEVLGRTQFEGGVATRPEILRSHLLRLPTQFKNFMAQQIGFVMGLRGAEIPRFLGSLFLLAGAFGLVLLPAITEMIDWLTGWDPLNWLRDQVIRAGAEGALAGTAADVLARGLPALLGIDISGRVGMGVGFVPESPSDLTGPFIGTLGRMKQLGENNARVTDYLAALTPAANPLRVLEAAANGASIFSEAFWTGGLFGDGKAVMRQPTKRGQIQYAPTNAELVVQGMGFRPLRAALLQDARQVEAEQRRERRRDVNFYLAEIVDARRNMPHPDLQTPHAEAIRERQRERIRRAIQNARADGVRLTQRQINEALKAADRPQADRDLQNAPRDQRREMRERQRAIEERAR
jgi:N12 class adenine-specific DNA methylase